MKRLGRILIWTAVIAAVALVLSPVFTGGRYETDKPGQQANGAGGSGGGRRDGRHGKGGDMPVPVLTATTRAADVPVYIEGVGTGKALQSVLIRSQADGTLLKLGFTEGQDVKAGDFIAQIDPRIYQATLDQNVAKKASDEALLANAKLDLDRYNKLAATKAATQQQLDTQKATVAQDEAQVNLDQATIDSARTSLSYTNITSPIAGRTGLRNVDVGNLIHATDTTGIVTVSQIRPMDVIFTVPQQELARINKASLGGTLEVEAHERRRQRPPITGRLDVIDNMIDQTTGTVKLRAEFPNPNLALWPGIFINVRLLVETLHNAVVAPVAAVQRGPKGPFVFVVAGGKAAMRPIVVGQQDDKEAVVASGVKPGETVVTTGFAKLADGRRSRRPKIRRPRVDGAPALHQGGVAPPTRRGSRRRGDGRPRRTSANE